MSSIAATGGPSSSNKASSKKRAATKPKGIVAMFAAKQQKNSEVELIDSKELIIITS